MKVDRREKKQQRRERDLDRQRHHGGLLEKNDTKRMRWGGGRPSAESHVARHWAFEGKSPFWCERHCPEERRKQLNRIPAWVSHLN